jgi:phosphonoacetaldehyde hydrolase
MGAFVRLFANHGVTISIAQARVPMGLPKLAHIEALGAMPEIAEQWQQAKGQAFTAQDGAALLQEFEPMSAASAMEHSDFIPGFLDTYGLLKERGIAVATTTGYTRKIMTPLIDKAARAGFLPARVICCDDVAQSRPSPLGMQECMQTLDLVGQGVSVVKVDDTVPGLQEGLNAGCWTVGVAASGNALGWSWEEWVQASEDERDFALLDAYGLDGIGEALSPSTQAMKMSCTPRLRSSVTTCSQNLAPSVCARHRPSTSFSPFIVMPMARYTALTRTAPSRTFTWMQSM